MNTKICFKCKKTKTLESFYAHPQMSDGHVNKCKTCNKLDVIKNRKLRFDYYRAYDKRRDKDPKRMFQHDARTKRRRKEYPGKAKANAAVHGALKNGSIVRPLNCSSCGSTGKIEAHHTDYRRFLFVTWLCIKCHHDLHTH